MERQQDLHSGSGAGLEVHAGHSAILPTPSYREAEEDGRRPGKNKPEDAQQDGENNVRARNYHSIPHFRGGDRIDVTLQIINEQNA